MTRQSRIVLLLALALAAVAVVPTAFARPSHAAGTSVSVSAGKPSEFSFTLSTKSVTHGSITFKVTNMSSSGLAKDFKICTSPTTATSAAKLANAFTGKGTSTLGKGQSATLSV